MEEEQLEEQQVTIRCMDDVELQVNKKALDFYPTLSASRARFYADGDDKPIDLQDVDPEIFNEIITWMNRHQNDKGRVSLDNLEAVQKTTFTSADKTHLESLHPMVFIQIMILADRYNLLDILEYSAQIAGGIFVNVGVQGLRDIFFEGESGFTEEEENKLREENQWIEEL
ncbi:uncharacterized protein LOC130666481 [Microplitis mediator]|uniref:uncharacterized protein LOC130666481 n=1 Tax=Microplitis mediator TaxID=375433 RepID=UPI002553AF53|nr:uncharacterized protein LOC130666481 [Microplitis mediator]